MAPFSVYGDAGFPISSFGLGETIMGEAPMGEAQMGEVYEPAA